MNKNLILILLTSTLFSFNACYASSGETAAGSYLQRDDVQAFIKKMIQQHQFSKKELHQWFAAIRPRADIIASISSPAEAKPWHVYRKIFITEKRIAGGVKFWTTHRKLLQRAEQKTGVPARIIVAILGVETLYNTYKGRHDVLESLATLSFDYPKRSKFFRSELEQFLLLAREEKVDPLSLKGSYAGAMGGPQFISSSFRHYAVDFDEDGKRDIWNNPADMIGSIANYFKVHGWRQGQAITFKTSVKGTAFQPVLKKGIKPFFSIEQIKKMGINIGTYSKTKDKAALIKLEQKDSIEYWLGLQNFYVITRYNHSPLYAMAVYQLSEKLTARMESR